MKICQIVGHKNTGKTTVMSQLIRHLTKYGWKVGTLKHHGHGGDPAVMQNTDTYQHFASGASLSAVQGETSTEILLPNIPVAEMMELYQLVHIDILLVEGFKQAVFPKIVLVKNEEDVSLLHRLSTIIAVGTWNKGIVADVDYPVFSVPKIETHLGMLADIIVNEGC